MLIEFEELHLWLMSLGVELSGSSGCATCKALSM